MRKQTNTRKNQNIVIIFCIFGLIALIVIINFSVNPIVMDMAAQQGSASVLSSLNSAVDKTFEEQNIGYSDIVKLNYSQTGFVTSAEYDYVLINKLKLSISQNVADELIKLKKSRIKIPFGSIFGNSVLSGRGPNLRIYISQSSVPDISLISSFESVGINTVKHEIIMRITVDSKLFLPPQSYDFSNVQDYVIAQTLIVGNIPNGYAKIS